MFHLLLLSQLVVLQPRSHSAATTQHKWSFQGFRWKKGHKHQLLTRPGRCTHQLLGLYVNDNVQVFTLCLSLCLRRPNVLSLFPEMATEVWHNGIISLLSAKVHGAAARCHFWRPSIDIHGQLKDKQIISWFSKRNHTELTHQTSELIYHLLLQTTLLFFFLRAKRGEDNQSIKCKAWSENFQKRRRSLCPGVRGMFR